MAKPPADQHCMFCDPDPCTCNSKPAKKRVARKKVASSSTTSVSSTPVTAAPSAPMFDPKAAMKAAAETTTAHVRTEIEDVPTHSSDISSKRVRAAAGTRHSASESGFDQDTRRAIFALAPLFADSELAKYSDIINDPTLRAERWKQKRNDSV